MKYTVSEAARIVGLTRKTLYNHIDKKPISIEKDENGHPLIEASELIRVYGDRCNFDNKDPNRDTAKNKQEYPGVNTPKKEDTDTIQKEIELAVLQEKVVQLEILKENYDERVSYLQEALDKAQEIQKNQTRLLEHHSQPAEKNDWEKATKALEARISNQERTSKEQKEKAQRILQQNKKLRAALEREKNKTFWQKLFG